MLHYNKPVQEVYVISLVSVTLETVWTSLIALITTTRARTFLATITTAQLMPPFQERHNAQHKQDPLGCVMDQAHVFLEIASVPRIVPIMAFNVML